MWRRFVILTLSHTYLFSGDGMRYNVWTERNLMILTLIHKVISDVVFLVTHASLIMHAYIVLGMQFRRSYLD